MTLCPGRYRPFIYAGNGTCGDRAKNEDGTVTVRCLGPAHSLKPGQTVNTMMYLESPYPSEGQVIVLNLTSQLVDADERPVPLSDVGAPLAHAPNGFLPTMPFCVGLSHVRADESILCPCRCMCTTMYPPAPFCWAMEPSCVAASAGSPSRSHTPWSLTLPSYRTTQSGEPPRSLSRCSLMCRSAVPDRSPCILEECALCSPQ